MSPPDPARPLLLTGAAGRIGTWLRPLLAPRPGGLRSFDLRPIADPLPGETALVGDLADARAVEQAVDGAAAILHFGAVGVEDAFDPILRANIVGTYNVLEAARRCSVARVVLASSIHTIGLHPTTLRVDADTPPRPDSLYGVSKCFGEDLARLYADKAGLRVACLRIGVVAPEPTTPRNLWTWLSIADLLRLIDACLAAPDLRFAIVYGASGNQRSWWDNAQAGVDYRPQDDAERFAARIVPDGRALDPQAEQLLFHGGPFVKLAIGQRPG